jgi:hypothetical protein
VAAWNPSSSACGDPPGPVAALLTVVTTASTTAPPNWNDVVTRPASEPLFFGRDAGGGRDVERSVGEPKAEAHASRSLRARFLSHTLEIGDGHRVGERLADGIPADLVDRRVAKPTDLHAERSRYVRSEHDVRQLVEWRVGR